MYVLMLRIEFLKGASNLTLNPSYRSLNYGIKCIPIPTYMTLIIFDVRL